MKRLFWLVSIISGLLARPGRLDAQGTSCITTGASVESAQAYMQRLVTATSATDAHLDSVRTLYQLPQADSASVTVVTSDSLCQIAAAKYVQAFDSTRATAPVTVIKIGSTRYLIAGDILAGEYTMYLITDEDFNGLEAFGG